MRSEDEYSSDNGGKKRRPVGREGELFGSTKKMLRTPPNQGKKSEDKIDLIIEMIKELKADSNQIKAEQEACRREMERIGAENKRLREEIRELKEENREMQERFTEVNRKVDLLEREKRKKNIVIQGMNMEMIETNVLRETVERMIRKDMELEVQIRKAYKMGEKTCLIEFEKEEDKEKVMKNKYKLRENRNGKIYINNDETKKEREKGKQMRKIAKEQRDKGKAVKIGYNKLTVDGKIWKWNEEREILETANSKN